MLTSILNHKNLKHPKINNSLSEYIKKSHNDSINKITQKNKIFNNEVLLYNNFKSPYMYSLYIYSGIWFFLSLNRLKHNL
jgi:LysM repeat protein